MAKFSTCRICGKMVDIETEAHTLFHCRNFLLRAYYGETNEIRRQRLLERINALNARMQVKGTNLLDT
ncbi:MAG: hypothetical protein EOL86_08810 [Deltaproteobacteria bacterium]|nr:hypothetical protein [Desulfovibrionaceae bacterium]NCD25676.1 hypothetical protein [Deltaproteobacteria bacterium]